MLVKKTLIWIGLVATLLASGCGSSSKAPPSEGEVRPVRWTVFDQVGPKTLSIVAGGTHCSGHPRPEIVRVKRVEKEKKSYVTVFVYFPPHVVTDCPIPRSIYSKVHFARDLKGRTIIDGYSHAVKWPLPGRKFFTQYTQRGEVRAVRWAVSRQEGPRAFKVVASVPYCSGDLRPRISHVEQVEGKTNSHVTVFVHFVPRKVKGCLGVQLAVYSKVHFDHPLAGRKVFDGHSDAVRWPLPSNG